MTYISTKTYGHDIGLSVCFRQWRATHSHCSHLHGYALKIRVEFEAEELDDRRWVVDFGGLKSFKKWLEETFDHKLVVAKDDPQLVRIKHLAVYGIADVIELEDVGCEAFAKLVYDIAEVWLMTNDYTPRVKVREIEISEHGANSAIYRKSK